MARAAEAFLDPTVAGVRSRPVDPPEGTPARVSVLIVDDERLFAEALSSALGPDGNGVASLLAEGAALHLEADLKWLDLCERQLIEEEG